MAPGGPCRDDCTESERIRAPAHGVASMRSCTFWECRGQVTITAADGARSRRSSRWPSSAPWSGPPATPPRSVGARCTGSSSSTERLATATDLTAMVDTGKVDDARLRAGFGRLAERMGQAWTLATVDLLTGVLNRQALLARLEEELDRAARYQRPCSIVLVDLDHFKRVNDTHGHMAGDAGPARGRRRPPTQRPDRRPRRPLRRRGVHDRPARDRRRRGGVERREAPPPGRVAPGPPRRWARPGRHPERRRRRRPRPAPPARRARPRRRRGALLGQGARARPGLRLPRDRGGQPRPAGRDRAAGARARRRGRSGRDGRRHRDARRTPSRPGRPGPASRRR